jgi:kinesin family protein 20
MTDPTFTDNQYRYRALTVSPSSIYTFSHVFPPATKQSDFFTKTTLPLVQDVLHGQNALLFAYGVTNSGKTYTIQGGGRVGRKGSAGILPRTLDVIFNSIEGLQGDGSVSATFSEEYCLIIPQYRPVRLHGIEPSIASSTLPSSLALPNIANEPALAQVLADHLESTPSDLDIDPTILKLDRNYEYTVWLSYAEVYNEKIYDLLATVKERSDTLMSGIPRATATSASHPFLLKRKALPIRPSPPSDYPDPDCSTGKYIAGLRQFRVTSAEQAKALMKLGQLNRRVFGTLANSQSSRSHGLVTIRVLRGHRGEKDVSGVV